MSGSPRRTVVRSVLSAVLALLVSLSSLGAVALAPAAAETAGPTIASDQADYPPGGLVTLTGEGWLAGEAVHVVVNDDQGRTWERTSDVTASETGTIADVFNLPDWFVATYAVVATGEVSGVARTSFTDGNVKVETTLAATVPVTRRIFGGSTNCTTGGGTADSISVGTNGVTIGGLSASDSVEVTAPITVVVGANTHTLLTWSVANVVISASGPGTACIVGTSGNKTAVANYDAGVPTVQPTATMIVSSANPSTYGDNVTFTATVAPSPSPSGSGTVTFKDGTTTLCNAVAATGSVATCATSGLAAGNHAVTATFSGTSGLAGSASAVLTQVVGAKQLVGSFTASNKAYDGNTAATIASRSLSGVVGGDNVSLAGGTAGFGTASVGTSKTVTATGFTLSGTAAGNYALVPGPWTTTADITARAVTVSFTAADKVYDGDASATISSRDLEGVRADDVVTVSGGIATFGSKNAGTGKQVTAGGFVLGGADAGNYSVTSVGASSANIMPKPVTGSLSAANKIYDGDASATVLTRSLDGGVDGDDVSLMGGTATFDDKNVGHDKTVSLAGAGLAGDDAGNYDLTSVATTTASITARGVTVSFTAADKVYDGDASATISSRDLEGVRAGDVVAVSGGIATFGSKNVGTGKQVTAGGFVLGGSDAGNYSVTSVADTEADISPLAITGSFTAGDKVYDGNSDAEVLTRSVHGAVAGDAVSLTGGSATFGTKNVGAGKAVTLSGAGLAGGDAGNYALTSVAITTADITPLGITGSFTADDKVYDGDDSAVVLARSLHGDVDGDDVSLAGGSASFGSKNVGADKTVTLSGFGLAGGDAGNYTLSSVATTTADITPLGITGSFTAANKVYDGNADAEVLTRSLHGDVEADDVSLTDGTATFDNKNVGADKTVTLGGAGLSGDDAGNYALDSVSTATADMTPLAVTGSFTADDKVYDGNVGADVLSRALHGEVEGDEVSLVGGTATFGSKNVGTGKTVTLSGAGLDGDDAGNYTLTSVSTTTASITARGVTVSFTAADKVYDGDRSAVIGSRDLAGLQSDDVVTVSGGTATFEDRNVGQDKTVVAEGFVLGGADGDNYSVTSVADAEADIAPLGITGSFTAADKVYDGDDSAAVLTRSLHGDIDGDDVSLTDGSATFDDKNVGEGKTVTLAGAGLAGEDAGNYTLGEVADATADITPLGITGSFTADDKVYDGNVMATVLSRTLQGVLDDDQGDVALDGGTATFGGKNVGEGKTVTLVDAVLTGPESGNYELISVSTATADVTPLGITGSFTADDKVYDGNSDAVVLTRSLHGDVDGDDVSLTGGSATFGSKNVGEGKTVTLSGAGLTGDDAGNYTLTSVATTTADITPLGITGSFTADDKVYDGNTDADVLTRSVHGELLEGDDVSLVGGSATFGSKNVGEGKTVTLSGAGLAGGDAGNYALGEVATTTADITPLGITGSFTAADKAYDGNVGADVLSRSLHGVLDDDQGDVALDGGTATFGGKNVGADKTVTLVDAVLTGPESANYDLTSVSTTTADITPLGITGSFTADDKVYDGDDSAVVLTRSLHGDVDGDAVSLTGGSATFGSKNVGALKTVTLTGFGLSGDDAGNYTLTSVATTTADITPRGITGSFTAANKVYDGNSDADVLTRSLHGDIDGDDVSLTGGSATFGSKNVGEGKAVTLSGFGLAGGDAGNYTLTSVATTTADVTPLGITGSFTADDKVYDGDADADVLTRSLHGDIAGDDVSLTDGSATFDDKNVGEGKAVTLSGFGLAGGDAGNYTLTSVATTTADITPLGITGSFTADDKVYDGAVSATVGSRSLHGAVAEDQVSLSGGTATFGNKNVGADKTVTLSGAGLTGVDAGNYTLSSVATTTADITPLGITGSFTAANKVYDGGVSATVGSRSLHGAVADDQVSLSGGTATFGSKNVGADKTVTLTGAGLTGVDAGNYTLTSVATTTANITPLGITGSFTADDKVYDGNADADVLTRSVHGDIDGDDVSLTGGSATFGNKNVGEGKTVTLSDAGLTGVDAGNYALTSVATTTANITRKLLTVTASSPGDLLLGAAVPVVTPSYDGFVAGEGTGALSTLPVCGTAYTVNSPVNTYSTGCSGGAAENYSFRYVDGLFRVLYGWDGFLQPINDTAHQTGVQLSQFKLGQTVPTKFVIRNISGQVVVASALPTFKAARLGSCGQASTVSEDLAPATPDSGSAFKWDGSKYQYNWSTKGLTAGLYRVRASLGDQSSATYVDICLAK